MKDLRLPHRTALATAGEFIARVQPNDFDRSTPCAEWDLGALLAHMIGQNNGFARAVADGDAEVNDYRPPMISAAEFAHAWAESADRLTHALAGADLERPVRLVEVRPNGTVSVGAVVGIHLLDTVVHTWDVATSLRLDYRPPDDLVNIVAAIAGQVPVGESRARPGAAFDPPLSTTNPDPWIAALGQLGRNACRQAGSGSIS